MSELWMLSEAQMRRIEPFFPLSHGVPRVDDRRIVPAIVYVVRHGLMWRDAPRAAGQGGAALAALFALPGPRPSLGN